MRIVEQFHQTVVYSRRLQVLAQRLSALLPPGTNILDVGTGDGQLATRIARLRPDVRLTGVDVLVRPHTAIPVVPFDGAHLPFPDDSFDVVMFVDVLHHTEDPMVMLREAARVSRRLLVIKDHTRNGLLAGPTLRLMDWVGNARHGVALPYNYWPERRWREAFDELNGRVESWNGKLGLYGYGLSLLFDRSLHFVASIALTKHDSKANPACKPEAHAAVVIPQ
jgi:SAM-dependent methyltransferase